MPALLLRFLPHGLVIAAILGGLWWFDHQSYQRGKRDNEFERLVTARMITRAAREVERNLSDDIHTEAVRYGQGHTVLEQTRNIIQPTITKEIIREPRFSDPDLGLTDLLFEAINRARGTSGTCSTTPGSYISCTLPSPASAAGQDAGGAGPEGQ